STRSRSASARSASSLASASCPQHSSIRRHMPASPSRFDAPQHTIAASAFTPEMPHALAAAARPALLAVAGVRPGRHPPRSALPPPPTPLRAPPPAPPPRAAPNPPPPPPPRLVTDKKLLWAKA